MPIVEKAIEAGPGELDLVVVEVDRHSLQKCRWRKSAADGTDFAFSLREPLADGACVLETDSKRYRVCQLPEAVLIIPLPGDPLEVARLAWAIGNLHQPIEARDAGLLVGDDPSVRRLLGAMGIGFESGVEVFRPPVGASANHHVHVPGLEYEHRHFIFGHESASPF
jgi:urease accessory protein